jgi:hypothetical protein
MARKKSRPSRPAPRTETAVVTAPASTAVTATPPTPIAADRPPDKAPAERFWLEVAISGFAGSRWAHWLGSLQLAVVLLSVFAVVLAVGTIVESDYSAKVAQVMIYQSWWFSVLLFLLGINIFFAAAKKARFRGEEDVGREINGTGYFATLEYWWPWIVVADIFVFLLLPRLPWGAVAVILVVSGAVMSLALWGVQRHWPVETWWPWKKHQTGFLITHVGLLTMVAGGILNVFGGTDAQMVVVDSPQPHIQDRFGPQVNHTCFDVDNAIIRVRLPSGKEETFRFEPGSISWGPGKTTAHVDTLLTVLDWLAHPLPRSWSAELQDGARLTVLGYYPQARAEKFRPAEGDDEVTFPAVKYRLTSPRAGALPEEWVAHDRTNQTSSAGAGMVEMLGAELASEQLKEFLDKPPSDEQLGKRGQLIVWYGGKRLPLALDQLLDDKGGPRGEAVALGDSGWKLRVTKYLPNMRQNNDPTPSDPVLRLELTGPKGERVEYGVVARDAGRKLFLDGKPDALQSLGNFQVWYHLPDWRLGAEQLRAVLHFVTDKNGKLYFRSFNTRDQKFQFEKSGELEKGTQQPIWQGMDWRLQVTDFLPRAAAGTRYIPEEVPPGVERLDLTAALRCKLTVGKDAKEFWLGKTEGGLTTVALGGKEYRVGYNPQTRDLGFEIKLLRAEQTNDRGTNSAATYTSWVQLTDEREGIRREDRMITMNEPLDHRGYKLYQSGYTLLGIDENGKPVSRSVFTVGRDPGLPLKYLGSTMLALGIVCMFYMKAYFFKPRRK